MFVRAINYLLCEDSFMPIQYLSMMSASGPFLEFILTGTTIKTNLYIAQRFLAIVILKFI